MALRKGVQIGKTAMILKTDAGFKLALNSEGNCVWKDTHSIALLTQISNEGRHSA